MSIPEPTTKNASNSTSASPLSKGNISQVPGSKYSSIERFAQAPASEGTYFASARMSDRSAHLTRLSSQLDAMDEIMRARN
ncbi:uncharacterized protein N7515_006298 [Penicillium bovifimosum]|uniref:Uncharacterized protein n=1 Tax=Penicillium bovifimosum TaxID=126998 RepID=A0A9W9GUE7_9EURO|nr:uncharacterized protein N7515_006298 [Penicillium bovifimosum]KAJ5130259.1 hypothetical protein N7515_006298 [Penicillium bovifimosum]